MMRSFNIAEAVMSRSDFSPYQVLEHSRDVLVEFIRYKTGWNERNEVTGKHQLTYLCNYLEIDHIDTSTLVIENEYIDRHYLEDYSEYYARCFSDHPRTCSRVHFFRNKFSQREFVSAITNPEDKFRDELNKNYIGFIVIRPLPHTFLARVCITPYSELISNKKKYKIITSSHDVSLFGLPLQVNTSAFLEQDKVVAACATSALWALLSASNHINRDTLPSPSAITKSAVASNPQESRTFPSNGLSAIQVLSALKYYQMEPSQFYVNELKNDLLKLKEISFAYLNNDIPMLLGGSIYERIDDEKDNTKGDGTAIQQGKYLGKHFVCMLGFSVNSSEEMNGKEEISFRSHSIDQFYVHDDRLGPFVRLTLDPVKFQGLRDNETEELFGLEVRLDSSRRVDYFVPDIAIVGLYHKVRLSYNYIKSTILALHNLLSITLEKAKKQSLEKTLIDGLSSIVEGEWDIQLVTNNNLKQELAASDDFATFNGIPEKTEILLKSFPKFIWRLKIRDSEGQDLSDLLFDATEVTQGNVLLGYIAYSPITDFMWKYLEVFISDRAFVDYPLYVKEQATFGAIIKFFSRDNTSSILNSNFGPIRVPARRLKNGETDQNQNVSVRDVRTLVEEEAGCWDFLENTKKYIWVINESGLLVVGEDIRSDSDSGSSTFKGHPTLVDAKPARLGGELNYNHSDEKWMANLASGAYSGHLERHSDEAKAYLDNVIKLKMSRLEPAPEY